VTETTTLRVFIGRHQHPHGEGPEGWRHAHGADGNLQHPAASHWAIGEHQHELLPLAAQAVRELADLQAANAEQKRQELAAMRESDLQQMRQTAAAVLGAAYLDGVDFAVEHDGDGGFYDERRAAFTVDGLRFLVVLTPEEFGPDVRLYALRPCDSLEHEPADERVVLAGLTDLALALADQPTHSGATWHCQRCAELRRGSEPTAEPEPFEPSTSLAEQLDMLVRAIVDHQLDQRGVAL